MARGIDRRTFLRGAGSVAVGLPLLPEMTRTAFAGPGGAAAERVITLFWGNNIFEVHQRDGLVGPLEPLAAFASKLCIPKGAGISESNHTKTSGARFVGDKPRSGAQASGPSIDQVVKAARYVNGQVPTPLQNFSAAAYFRRSFPARYVKTWNDNGNPVMTPLESPGAMFDRLFGMAKPPPSEDPSKPAQVAAARRRRLERSVLDTTLESYRHYTGAASGLSSASRVQIKEHLDRIREFERELPLIEEGMGNPPPAGGGAAACGGSASRPSASNPAGSQDRDATPSFGVSEYWSWWRLMADLYALGLECDLYRFGNLTFQSGGERIKLSGRHRFANGSTYTFNDSDAHHEAFHKFGRERERAEAHIHLIMDGIAYFLEKLDAVAEPNGRSLLENALIIGGAELGDEGHSGRNVFHFHSSAGGRLNVGVAPQIDTSLTEYYRTLAYGVGVQDPSKLGNSGHFDDYVSGLLA